MTARKATTPTKRIKADNEAQAEPIPAFEGLRPDVVEVKFSGGVEGRNPRVPVLKHQAYQPFVVWAEVGAVSHDHKGGETSPERRFARIQSLKVDRAIPITFDEADALQNQFIERMHALFPDPQTFDEVMGDGVKPDDDGPVD